MSDKNVFSYFKRVYTDKAEYREQNWRCFGSVGNLFLDRSIS